MQAGIDVPVLYRRWPNALHARSRARGRRGRRPRLGLGGDGTGSWRGPSFPACPVFSSETYPGWLTHWGEAWARPALDDLLKEVTFLLANRKSFNFYVAHGGTNFGFTAGANSGGKGYEPDLTSYDYDAPIDEQGRRDGEVPRAARAHRLLSSGRAGAAAGPGADSVDRRPRVRDARPRVDLEPPAGADRVGAAAPVRVVRPEPGAGALSDDAGGPEDRAGSSSPTCTTTRNVFVDGTLVGTLDRRLGREVDRVASHRQPDARRSTSWSRAWDTSTSRRR